MRRLKTPDWGYVGWHYRAIHRVAQPLHNPLVVRANGVDNIPREGGFLLAGNHTSWWDPIVLQTTTPRPVNWLAKKEMMNNRFNKWFFFDKGGCIPVDRNAQNPEAFHAATQALRDGRIIGIFPEGTRHVGTLGPAKTGVARLAMESGAPVVPVGILSDRFWGKGKKLPDLRHKVWLNVGKPMHLSGDARAETDRVMGAIGALLDEARRARDAKARWARP
ncbi:MAG TPA: lysophospholipid acyltransferase family protein [Candidatus Thermoplasmatota archaeon]|nr:lysophospholipid acyltransferase family protein [Candidatus Thermoplasmatota archaeon]